LLQTIKTNSFKTKEIRLTQSISANTNPPQTTF